MFTYSLDHFNPDYFERLSVALAQEFVARGLLPYGAGRDGGREATYEGRMDYPSVSEPWDGYLVLQAKFKRERSEDKRDEATWAIGQLNDEMMAYKRGERRVPDYYLFVTNVALTPFPEKGGLDRFNAKLAEWVAKLGLKGAHVWHGDKLFSLLDAAPKVAGRFGLLHGGDVLHHVAQSATRDQRRTERTLALYLEKELQADQAVRLAQAGHDAEEPTPLPSVFVDLVARPASESYDIEVVSSVQRETDRPLDPDSLERSKPSYEDDLRTRIDTSRGKYAIVGGPGSGKTTLTQHIVQRHRAALLLRNKGVLSAPIRRAIQAIQAEADDGGDGLPVHPRVPFRVVLDQFADALAGGKVTSVIDFIADRVRQRTGRALDGATIESLMESGPILVAFDGLDEVPATSNRDAVMEAVADFLALARHAKTDLAVIATTRPQGYDAEFAQDQFEHLELQLLTPQKAMAYGHRFADVRYASDVDRRDKVVARLEGALAEPATARLMTSPLQVTIMAALVDLVGNPPRERYALFDRYYDIVYQREQERGLGASEVLAEHRADIDAIHDTVGLLLQIETEGDRRAGAAAGGSSGRLSENQLRSVVLHRLRAEGYEGAPLDDLTLSLLKVALDRLVFITPLEDGRYGFEVRSLQEFAAARALVRGGYDDVKKRLSAVAPAPYWRNVVLFAIGKAFTGREPREDLRDLAVTLCEDLDAEGPYPLSRTGGRLALDILEDGIADRKPAYYKKFFARAAELLVLPDVASALRLGSAYRPDCRIGLDRALATADVLAATALLARLESFLVPWAADALSAAWPTDDALSRLVYDRIAEVVVWSPQRLAHAEDLAGRSERYWAQATWSRHVPPESWVASAASLWRNRSEMSVPFVPDEEGQDGQSDSPFTYRVWTTASIAAGKGKEVEALERIAAAAPSHPSWRALLTGLPWLRDPTPESLAASLDALAEVGAPENGYYTPGALGWPFASAARNAAPPALRELAAKARSGELGGATEWAQAEERWRENGVSPSDWAAVTDASWPYDETIGTRGVPPFTGMTVSVNKEFGLTGQLFLDAVRQTTSAHAQKHIANGFWFYCSANRLGEGSAPLSLSLTSHMADLDDTWLYADMLGELVSPHASPETQADIDRIGRLCRLDVSERDRGKIYTEALTSLLPLVQPGASGVVRLVAGLILGGALPPELDVEPETLDDRGRTALLLIDMHHVPPSPQRLAERMAVALLSSKPGTTGPEAAPLIETLLQRKDPVRSAASLAPLLIHDVRFPTPIREAAVEVLTDLSQKTDSGLASNDLRQEVGLDLPSI